MPERSPKSQKSEPWAQNVPQASRRGSQAPKIPKNCPKITLKWCFRAPQIQKLRLQTCSENRHGGGIARSALDPPRQSLTGCGVLDHFRSPQGNSVRIPPPRAGPRKAATVPCSNPPRPRSNPPRHYTKLYFFRSIFCRPLLKAKRGNMVPKWSQNGPKNGPKMIILGHTKTSILAIIYYTSSTWAPSGSLPKLMEKSDIRKIGLKCVNLRKMVQNGSQNGLLFSPNFVKNGIKI